MVAAKRVTQIHFCEFFRIFWVNVRLSKIFEITLCYTLCGHHRNDKHLASNSLIDNLINQSILQGFTKEFTSMKSLITHHSIMPEFLPCPLNLNSYNNADSFEDHFYSLEQDYCSFEDVQQMLTNLNFYDSTKWLYYNFIVIFICNNPKET